MQTLIQILWLLDDLANLGSKIRLLLTLLCIILCLKVDFIFVEILNIHVESCLVLVILTAQRILAVVTSLIVLFVLIVTRMQILEFFIIVDGLSYLS